MEDTIPLPGLRQILKDSPHLHPAHGSKAKGNREVSELIKHWDGKKVWALFEDKMWRQGSVIATIPNRAPGKPWVFILHTKHDVWRHVILATPVDDTDLEFDTVQLTDYFDPSETDHHKPVVVDEHELIPVGSSADLMGRPCPVHPYIAAYIKRLKDVAVTAPEDIRNMKDALAKKERECEELKAQNDKMMSILREKHEEAKSFAAQYNEAQAELDALRLAMGSLKGDQGAQLRELESQIKRLSGEVSTYREENTQLKLQIRKLNEELLGYTSSSPVGSVDLSELQINFNKLKELNEQVTTENRHLRDRIIALEEALQKTIVCDNEANHHRAQVHAAEIANLEAEISKLSKIFEAYKGRGASTDYTVDSDPRVLLEAVTRLATEKDFAVAEVNRLEAAAKIAMDDANYSQQQTAIQTEAVKNQADTISKLNARVSDLESGVKMTKSSTKPTVGDASAISQLRRENDELKAQLAEVNDVNFGSLLDLLRVLNERCQSLELKARMPAKGLSASLSFDESDDPETTGDEIYRQERKRIKKRIQLANEVKGQLSELGSRLVSIEKQYKVPTPGAEPASPAPRTNSGIFGRPKKSEINTLQMQVAMLKTENAKLRADATSSTSPTASEDQVQALRKEVMDFEQRLQRVAEVSSSAVSAGASQGAQGSMKIRSLEKEIINLKGKLDQTSQEHKDHVDGVDALLQPLHTENEQMRARLSEYHTKIGELTAENEKYKADASSSIFSVFMPSATA